MDPTYASNSSVLHGDDLIHYSRHDPNGGMIEQDDHHHELEESYEETRDDDSIKLFVGQVPRTMEVDDIRPIMEEFGDVVDLVIIRDKVNGAHRGCAFVTFSTREAGEAAILTLHNQITLPPSANPLQVRPAEGQPAATQEHKLFIGMLPKSADEEVIQQLFTPYGQIEEVYILRHQSSGQSKGCAFLKYKDRNSALMAIEAVHGRVVMEGGNTTLVVKFADTRRQRLQKQRNQVVNNTGYWPMPPPPSNLAFPQMQQMQHQYIQQMQVFGGNQPAGNGSPYMMYNPYGYGYGFHPSQPFGFSTGAVVTEQVSAPVHAPASVAVDVMGSKQSRTSCQLEDADLATAFAPFGTVISAKVYMDKNTGESKGFGFVSYDSVQAAEAAITSMNGFQIGSKRLKVQHKRVHSREDYDESNSEGDQIETVDGLGESVEDSVNDGIENGSRHAGVNLSGLDVSLENSVQNLRLSG